MNAILIAFPVAALGIEAVKQAVFEEADMFAMSDFDCIKTVDMSLDELYCNDRIDCIAYEATQKFVFVRDEEAESADGGFFAIKNALMDAGQPFDEHDDGDGMASFPSILMWRPGFDEPLYIHSHGIGEVVMPVSPIMDMHEAIRDGEINIAEALDCLNRLPAVIYKRMPLSDYR